MFSPLHFSSHVEGFSGGFHEFLAFSLYYLGLFLRKRHVYQLSHIYHPLRSWGSLLLYFHFKKLFYFEIITDSQEVTKILIIQRRCMYPSCSFPQCTYSIIPKPGIDISAVLCHFISCVNSCNTTALKVQNCSITTKIIFVLLLNSYSPSLPSLTPWQLLVCLYFYDCVILRILYKWNYVVHYLWNDLYLPQHNALKIHPNCTLWSLYLSSIWYYRYTMVCLTIYLLKDILVVSNF